MGRSRGLRVPMEMPRVWGMGDKSRAGSRVPSGAGAVSVERGGCPESSTCPWGVGLTSRGRGCDPGACFAGCDLHQWITLVGMKRLSCGGDTGSQSQSTGASPVSMFAMVASLP